MKRYKLCSFFNHSVLEETLMPDGTATAIRRLVEDPNGEWVKYEDILKTGEENHCMICGAYLPVRSTCTLILETAMTEGLSVPSNLEEFAATGKRYLSRDLNIVHLCKQCSHDIVQSVRQAIVNSRNRK